MEIRRTGNQCPTQQKSKWLGWENNVRLEEETSTNNKKCRGREWHYRKRSWIEKKKSWTTGADKQKTTGSSPHNRENGLIHPICISETNITNHNPYAKAWANQSNPVSGRNPSRPNRPMVGVVTAVGPSSRKHKYACHHFSRSSGTIYNLYHKQKKATHWVRRSRGSTGSKRSEKKKSQRREKATSVIHTVEKRSDKKRAEQKSRNYSEKGRRTQISPEDGTQGLRNNMKKTHTHTHTARIWHYCINRRQLLKLL